jgi:hypothetical protein
MMDGGVKSFVERRERGKVEVICSWRGEQK